MSSSSIHAMGKDRISFFLLTVAYHPGVYTTSSFSTSGQMLRLSVARLLCTVLQWGCRLHQYADFSVFKYTRSTGFLRCMHYSSVSRFWWIDIIFRHGYMSCHSQEQNVIIFPFQHLWHMYYSSPPFLWLLQSVMIFCYDFDDYFPDYWWCWHFLIWWLAICMSFLKNICVCYSHVQMWVSNESIAYIFPFA